MPDSQYKTTKLPARIRGSQPSAPAGVSWPAPLMRLPWREALRAIDSVPSAYRVALVQHTGGSGEWCSGNFAVGVGTQNYPEANVWRTVARTRFELAPGCALQLRVVAVRSGPSVRYVPSSSTWEIDAIGGALRAEISYVAGADVATATVELELPASDQADAWEPTTDGASWGALVFRGAVLVLPSGFMLGPSEAVKWSEGVTVVVELLHRGGARVICAALSEVPHTHTVAHDSESVSIHGWPEQDQQPDARPQIESRDGVSFEEHRFGPWRSLAAAARQRQTLGPIIAAWGAYSEALAEVTDTDTDPISVTSTSWVGLSIGSAITTWAMTNPGHSISGHYSRPMPEASPLRARTSASIPARVRVLARFTGAGSNTGEIKIQTTARSSVIVTISQSAIGSTWTWVTATAWLECSTGPDDTYPVLQDFARTTGGTLEIRAWCVGYGHASVAA